METTSGWRARPRRHTRTVVATIAALLGSAVLVVTSATSARAVTPSINAASIGLATIQPGAHPALTVNTPVNVVFVGYAPKSVNVNAILGQLPAEGDPIVRTPAFIGLRQDVGLRYRYHYRVRFAGRAFDDSFFGYLATAGPHVPRTPLADFYNTQLHNSVDIGPTELALDTLATEAWLEQQSGAQLGINPAEDTVFLINWWGRSDFQFHIYLNPFPADPDTGDNSVRLGSLVRGWGGASGPTWFLDLSADPVFIDDSMFVDDADTSGDGIMDYRIPPIWDYGSTGAYRPFTDLSGDLAKIIRYVAVDLLFTPSPIYDPAASVPGLGGGKQIALDILEGDPATNGSHDVHANVLQARHQALEPYYKISVKVRDLPFDAGAAAAVNNAANFVLDPGCPDQFGDPQAAELVCYFGAHRSDYFTSAGATSVIPTVGLTVPANPGLFFTGYAMPAEGTGAPSFIAILDTPSVRSNFGYAYTTNGTHEAGHFVGLSHPHDGYDSTAGIDFDAIDATDFAWLGDESSTVMSYLVRGAQTFDEFDRDNLARWQVGRLLDLADTDTAAILAQPGNGVAAAPLLKAEGEFRAAVKQLGVGNWESAAADAVAGYSDIQRADNAVGLTPSNVPLARAGLRMMASVPPDAGVKPAPTAAIARLTFSRLKVS